MDSYVTWAQLFAVIIGLCVTDVLIHVGSDLVKLAWSRWQARKKAKQL